MSPGCHEDQEPDERTRRRGNTDIGDPYLTSGGRVVIDGRSHHAGDVLGHIEHEITRAEAERAIGTSDVAVPQVQAEPAGTYATRYDAALNQAYECWRWRLGPSGRRCSGRTRSQCPLRAMVRDYIESFAPIRIRPSGGVYFVGAQHAKTLTALRQLVAKFGNGSNLARVPLPGQEEMREMVISSFIARAHTELAKLADEIRKTKAADTAAIQALHKRYTELAAQAAEHEQLLSGSIDDAQASMQLITPPPPGLLLLLTTHRPQKGTRNHGHEEPDRPSSRPADPVAACRHGVRDRYCQPRRQDRHRRSHRAAKRR